MVNGKLKALAAEERFSRLKNDCGYPRQAIDFCMKQCGVLPQDIDKVAFATVNMNAFYTKLKSICSFSGEDWEMLHHEYWKPKIYENREDRRVFERLANDQRLNNQYHFYDFSQIDGTYDTQRDADLVRKIRLDGLKRHLGIGTEKTAFFDHHSCHAYYALFASPIRIDNTMVYTLDGGGDSTTSTLFRFSGGKIEELARSNAVDIARIYREMTLIMGMKTGEHEHKVMGLAPYAPVREAKKSFAVFDGMFTVNNDLITYQKGCTPKDLYFHFIDAFTGHRFDGIAAAVQLMVEDSVTRWFREVQAKYRSNSAVFAGGVAMNVKLNMLLAQECGLEDFYVAPSPSDDTLCIGACYMAEVATEPNSWENLHPVDDPYLGPNITDDKIANALKNSSTEKDFKIEYGVTAGRVAEFLDEGHVVARVCGRMEFGARALGNRSILADPRNTAVVNKINRQIKNRDFWMPFAPVVMEQRATDYFEEIRSINALSYMMIATQTTEQGAKDLVGATHSGDATVRPQILSESQNPAYFAILKEFEKLTGVGGLLNTSFNLHGEPIACTPEDAISTFERSELDILLMNGVALKR